MIKVKNLKLVVQYLPSMVRVVAQILVRVIIVIIKIKVIAKMAQIQKLKIKISHLLVSK